MTLPLSAALLDLAATDATDPRVAPVAAIIRAEVAGYWGVATGREITEAIAARVLIAADAEDAARARIARALDALRTAPDLDTIERGKAAWRQTHTAILGAWAELAEEPPSQRGLGVEPDC